VAIEAKCAARVRHPEELSVRIVVRIVTGRASDVEAGGAVTDVGIAQSLQRKVRRAYGSIDCRYATRGGGIFSGITRVRRVRVLLDRMSVRQIACRGQRAGIDEVPGEDAGEERRTRQIGANGLAYQSRRDDLGGVRDVEAADRRHPVVTTQTERRIGRQVASVDERLVALVNVVLGKADVPASRCGGKRVVPQGTVLVGRSITPVVRRVARQTIFVDPQADAGSAAADDAAARRGADNAAAREVVGRPSDQGLRSGRPRSQGDRQDSCCNCYCSHSIFLLD